MLAVMEMAFSAHWRALVTSWVRVADDFSEGGGSCWAREMERLFTVFVSKCCLETDGKAYSRLWYGSLRVSRKL